MANVDGPGNGKVVSGGMKDVTACATAVGLMVVTGKTVVGTPIAVRAWFVPFGITVIGSALPSGGREVVTAVVVAIGVAMAVATTAPVGCC